MHSILLSELLLSACSIEAAFTLIAANDTRRCTACYTWYIDLDSPKSSSSYLKGLCFNRYSKTLARDTCPQCQQENIEVARANEKRIFTAHQHFHPPGQHAEPLTATKHLRTILTRDLRRYLAKRDVKLYQVLRDSGSKLPALPSQCKHDGGVESLLNLKQERALFHALQELGAFRYPGMAENMRDREGRVLPDEKIFEIIRQRDCRWNVEKGWVRKGHRVSFEKPPSFSEHETKHAIKSKARRWSKKGKVSGRTLPKRMDRAEFKLEPIVEVDEAEAVANLEISVGWPLAN